MKGQLRGVVGPLVKLVAFAVVTIMASYVLVSTITNAGYGDQVTYKAQFSDVAGLVEGDEIRIAGVRVGQIVGIGLGEGDERPVAEVEFEVSKDVPLPAAVEATIKYRNLVGQRYIALTEGEGSGGDTLAEGAVIPLSQTTPPSTSPSSSAASSRCCRRSRRRT
ncbi:MlaD family protein [Blastococcus sp. PRF04-17]|uniref:MlaD family protein n=1 Tax=Blastococcus sp. PRF04-17 TaxID=2933797 RepID=UPI001FF62875|nr:MlaD family protein [Blastococcus sp. PRF04-17]UOY01035.1 MlaD family protein [Blastococcus sp. PRF04-17]